MPPPCIVDGGIKTKHRVIRLNGYWYCYNSWSVNIHHL